MDDDLQHQPKYINDLYNAIATQDVDVIVAKWKQDETLLRNVGSYIFSTFNINFRINQLRNTAFRILKKEVKSELQNIFLKILD